MNFLDEAMKFAQQSHEMEGIVKPPEGLHLQGFEKDAEVLNKLKDANTTQLIEGIKQHLEQEGRPGSAEVIDLRSKSMILGKQIEMAISGNFDPQLIEQADLPIMLDMEHITPEMLQNYTYAPHEIAITPEFQTEFIGACHTLKYRLDQHINKTANRAADYYSNELTRERTLNEKLKELFGAKPEPYEIPFVPTDRVMEKLRELDSRKFYTRDELVATYRRELLNLMKANPAIIGLEGSARDSKYLEEVLNTIGGKTKGLVNGQMLSEDMPFLLGMLNTELQIYPEFSNAIYESVGRELSSERK